MKLGEIAQILNGTVSGDAELDVTRLVHPADAAGPGDLAMALAKDALAALRPPAVAAVVKDGAALPDGFSAVLCGGHERLALAVLTGLFEPQPVHVEGIDASARVAPDVELGEGISIGAAASVGSGSRIGAGTIILPGATVGAGVTIGRDCVIFSGARIADRMVLGDRVRIGENSVIGSAGFGFVPVREPGGARNPVDMPAPVRSLGIVVIGDDVEIGSGTMVDRGTLRDTRIGRGTKIDNLVQIAHNVVIGESCVICAMSGIAGSSELGDRVILGAGTGIADHVQIGDEATTMAGSGVGVRVAPGEIVGGLPSAPRSEAAERVLNVMRLKRLYPRVDELARRIDALEKERKGR